MPTLVDGDFVLWESNSIMRYLCLAYGKGTPIYPEAPKRRAGVDRWLDWTLSTVQPVDRPVFWAIVRTAPEKQDMGPDPEGCRRGSAGLGDRRSPALDAALHGRRSFTIADIAVGAYARRWLGFKGIKQPKFPHLERWFAELASRPAFARHLGGAMS